MTPKPMLAVAHGKPALHYRPILLRNDCSCQLRPFAADVIEVSDADGADAWLERSVAPSIWLPLVEQLFVALDKGLGCDADG